MCDSSADSDADKRKQLRRIQRLNDHEKCHYISCRHFATLYLGDDLCVAHACSDHPTASHCEATHNIQYYFVKQELYSTEEQN